MSKRQPVNRKRELSLKLLVVIITALLAPMCIGVGVWEQGSIDSFGRVRLTGWSVRHGSIQWGDLRSWPGWSDHMTTMDFRVTFDPGVRILPVEGSGSLRSYAVPFWPVLIGLAWFSMRTRDKRHIR